MFRNLVLKFPSLRCTSEYAFSSACRKRSFRSLSPIRRMQPDLSAVTKRSASSSRTEKIQSLVDTHEKPLARNLCFSKEYYGSNNHTEIKEIEWREKPSKPISRDQKDDIYAMSENVQFESLEQYELEAARPRATKSSDLIDAFSSKSKNIDRYFHLQPNQMKPYGSCENFYAPSLIKPTSSLKYPKKFKKQVSENINEPEANYSIDRSPMSRGYRRFSTLSLNTPMGRRLSTSKSCIAKEGYSTKGKSCEDGEFSSKHRISVSTTSNQPQMHEKYSKRNFDAHENHWSIRHKALEFSPPSFQPFAERNIHEILETSTPAMRKRRTQKENQRGSVHYKSSYSDLVKQKLKEKEDSKLGLTNEIKSSISSDKMCIGCTIKDSEKPNKMLDAFGSLPGRRSITTRSKTNILSNERHSVLESNKRYAIENEYKLDDQKYYSKHTSKVKNSSKTKKVGKGREYNPECEDICSPFTKALEKKSKRRFPYEPDKCKNDEANAQKVYLPSKIKLPVAPCTPRPEYRDCVKIDPCDVERADECLEIKPKQLPKLVAGKCECIDAPQPTIAPKLQKLHFKFEDPPKAVCHEPPCQTPRADDSNPYKHKPLKPYMPGECACVETPPMTDVKLKRLPRCEPDEVCRPPRICPVIETCPPRADECYKVIPKKLPPMAGTPCPCVEPPQPTIAPPIKRLDLSVPEPERVCPRPPRCDEVDRADKHRIPKLKMLPKFVPGDCPCEDRPLVDWNLKRLVCEDEVQECIVPDPCKTFPRADWGCWEYSQEACEEVDEKCVDKREKCVEPKVKPCRKKSICETSTSPLDYRHVTKRKFSNSSNSSIKLYQKMKSKNGSNTKQDDNNHNKKEPENHKTENVQYAAKSKRNLTLKAGTKKEPSSAIHLIKALNDFEKHAKDKHDYLLFKPRKTNKIDYQSILNNIASTSLKLEKNTSSLRNESLRKSKINTLTVPSRAICTTEYLSKSESEKKKEKECEVKEKCRKIKPSIKSMMCRRSCPRYHVCPGTAREHRPSCRKDRVPVCCEKEEPPYSAFTDNLPDSIQPFTDTPQWTCNRRQYGFHPVYKKEYELIDPEKKKDKKTYCTLSLSADLRLSNDYRAKDSTSENVTSAAGEVSKTKPLKENSHLIINKDKHGNMRPISKGLLKRIIIPNISASHSRPLTTKIFQIHQPEVCKKPKGSKECKNKMRVEEDTPKISCITKDTCKTQDKSCFRHFKSCKVERKPPPFPAFSDCLDEEMEDILTECPLDREKYLRMQPRFMNPPPKPVLLKPPPPNQGKIDILKEQQCIREKLCLKNEGLSQSCTDFGKPVPLMKTKKEGPHSDCQRIEELKKMGRWPPFTLKSNRRYSTAPNISNSKFRSYSTLGLNSIKDVVIEKSYNDSKRIYMRNYHALLKYADQSVFAVSEEKLTKITQKTLPNSDKKILASKMENIQWRMQDFNIYDQINKPSNSARKVKRYFSTYRIKRQNAKRQFAVFSIRRSTCSCSPILRRKMQYFRGNRYYKSGNTKRTAADRQECKIKSHKKECPKFTLKNCPARAHRKKCQRIPVGKDCTKPFSPYPAYSECKEHELVAPSCECGYEVERMVDLQPRFSLLHERTVSVQEFPSQERIDRALGIEYYKCKHGIGNEGQTIGCEALGHGFHQKHKNERLPQAQEDCQRHEQSNTNVVDSKENRSFECIARDHKISKSETSNEATDSCEVDRKKIEDVCVTECLKSIPCHLPEEEKYCICKANCEKLFEEGNSSPHVYSKQNKIDEDKCSPEPAKTHCTKENGKHQKNDKKIIFAKQCIKESEKPICKDMVLKSSGLQPRKSKSLTQLEKVWQKIVNYFKARPNCPQPGDYKKRVLREKAEKAAVAAGVIVVDPKCLPPEILKIAKVPKIECKVCPNQDPCESKKAGTRSNSPETNRRNFSTSYQSSRKYSKNISCKNLDEINRVLEEGEQNDVLFKNMRKPISVLHGGKDAVSSEELRMSLDMENRNIVDLSHLYERDHKCSKTYFGYSDIIPSRENILERAWRISIEAYDKYNCPRSYNSFNEFLSTVEKPVNTVEELEKMKTENVLRELDKYLNNIDPDATKKKK